MVNTLYKKIVMTVAALMIFMGAVFGMIAGAFLPAVVGAVEDCISHYGKGYLEGFICIFLLTVFLVLLDILKQGGVIHVKSEFLTYVIIQLPINLILAMSFILVMASPLRRAIHIFVEQYYAFYGDTFSTISIICACAGLLLIGADFAVYSCKTSAKVI